MNRQSPESLPSVTLTWIHCLPLVGCSWVPIPCLDTHFPAIAGSWLFVVGTEKVWDVKTTINQNTVSLQPESRSSGWGGRRGCVRVGQRMTLRDGWMTSVLPVSCLVMVVSGCPRRMLSRTSTGDCPFQDLCLFECSEYKGHGPWLRK